MARVIHVYVSTIDGVPTIDFDLDLLHTRYALMLWHYGPRKEEEKAQSDDEAPMRHLRDIGITEDIKFASNTKPSWCPSVGAKWAGLARPFSSKPAGNEIIGIDLGTTNSCVAVMEGKVRTRPIEMLNFC
ncbi:hypothetical protein T459_31903 [Capsicum annuum]|uniref:Uncharacterized protein n=1 Tax=Capsicum annuum TaxID=4072 RepID=A0A2G2Y393_CAPAN|nr:hypothetical protein T459_31903 [Capsicum annuum]